MQLYVAFTQQRMFRPTVYTGLQLQELLNNVIKRQQAGATDGLHVNSTRRDSGLESFMRHFVSVCLAGLSHTGRLSGLNIHLL